MIDDQRQDDALEAMERTRDFSMQKNEYLQNMNNIQFMVLAQALFDAFYSKGLELMHGKDSEKALYVFLKAKRINDKYLGKTDTELNLMIYNATVPVILDRVKQAEFEVWANRTDKANDLLSEALNYQRKYDLGDNAEVNLAIDGLREKIKNRYCTSLNNELFAINSQAENRLKANKYLEAEKLLMKGINILENYPFCVLDGDNIREMYQQNKDAFIYYGIVNNINQNLEKKDYKEAIALFESLVQHYIADNIKRYGIEKPDPYQFVKSQKNLLLTQAAADFFVNSAQFETAFDYLSLLKQQNISSKETRDLQLEIGEGLANVKKDGNFHDKDLVLALNGEDKWYRYMQRAFDGKPTGFLDIFNRNK
jgi:hypothetical protein